MSTVVTVPTVLVVSTPDDGAMTVVTEQTVVTVTASGPQGPPGPSGPPGEAQVDWFSGEGPPPSVIQGAGPGDMYIDTLNGQLYQLH